MPKKGPDPIQKMSVQKNVRIQSKKCPVPVLKCPDWQDCNEHSQKCAPPPLLKQRKGFSSITKLNIYVEMTIISLNIDTEITII